MAGGDEATAPESGKDRLTGVLAGTLGEHHHVARHVLIFTAKAVVTPGTEAGQTGNLGTGIDEGDAGVVVDCLGVD